MSLLSDLTNLTGEQIVQTNTVPASSVEPFIALDVFAPGAIKIGLPDGSTLTETFPTVANGGAYPYRWWIKFVQVFDTGTDVADASLVGIKG